MKLIARCSLSGVFLSEGHEVYSLKPGDTFEAAGRDAESLLRRGCAEVAKPVKKAKAKPAKE